MINTYTYSYWQDELFALNKNKIKNLRKTYKHFPYLYEFDEVGEEKYMQDYLSAKDKLDAFVCLKGDELVGISIGCPLSKNLAICQELCELIGDDKGIYYFGDIIVDEQHWGHGIADILYAKHIEYVHKLQMQKIVALLVERDEDDPLKPINFNYTNLWHRHGFVSTSVVKHFSWQTIQPHNQASKMQQHRMRLYEKCWR